MEGQKRLVRSKKNRMLLGVLGGIAEYLDVDPTLVRLIFVVLLVFQPVAMTLLYFLAALVIPEESGEEKPVEERFNDIIRETEKVFSGEEKNDLVKALAVILILVGVLYLLAFTFPIFFVLRVPSVNVLLAILLLVLGIVLLLRGG
ncbi:PspC domain-containing protein [Thermococcus gorgonarius]|uniref:Transcriptional regulator n=1 Tax=Thermococcus gorgonarius TaxID=71997 RepID=A0A2Z2M8V8_THEGO|nr:PspC domain-containing protein [Thermococcus gorgonarius]ASJ00915.1 transcriptional regulator [Thermococcus gorgonarius]